MKIKPPILVMLFFLNFAASCEETDDNATSNSDTIHNNADTESDTLTRKPRGVFNLSASKNPPGGLQPSQVPQFVSLGFDDNGFHDSIEWIAGFLESHHNPGGSNNAATFDGQTLKATFFQTGSYFTSDGTIYGQSAERIINGLKKLYAGGNEIANHTYRHNGILTRQEFTDCTDALVRDIGIPANEIVGFRAPFLSYNGDAFDILYDLGFLYDCSIEQPWQDKTGADDYWPYTLHEPSPYQNPTTATLGLYPGMWEIPVYSFNISGSNQMETGFDYNFWAVKKLNKSTFVNTLKEALDIRLSGNRAPLTFGAHTDEYAWDNTDFDQSHATGATTAERREAIEAFLLYAISKPDVRVVTHRQIIQWMKNPVPLGSCTPNCNNKECGDDGCGGSCGTCNVTNTCNNNFQCEFCDPSCSNKDCGDDGCGGSCGSCDPDKICSTQGICTTDNANECSQLSSWQIGQNYTAASQVKQNDKKYQCKPWPYTAWCNLSAYRPGSASGDAAWIDLGDCGDNSCIPDCSNKRCGDDGCGSSCGTCDFDETCLPNGTCDAACTPDCTSKQCGDDGCGSSCGTCDFDETCSIEGSCIPNSIDCGGLPPWTAKTYLGGEQVKNGSNQYQCKPWPYNGWCGLNAYEPGNGTFWQSSWDLIGPCK